MDFSPKGADREGGKAGNDGYTPLPSLLGERLQDHPEEMRRVHQADLADGWAGYGIPMPWLELAQCPGGVELANWCSHNTTAG